jgi:uncharacterized DUF497 family protein
VIDLERLEGLEWDAGNARKSAAKHAVTQAEAEQVFFSELLVLDEGHSRSEKRFHALGSTREGRLLHVAFTRRAGGRHIRVISARPMSRKERRIHDEAP